MRCSLKQFFQKCFGHGIETIPACCLFRMSRHDDFLQSLSEPFGPDKGIQSSYTQSCMSPRQLISFHRNRQKPRCSNPAPRAANMRGARASLCYTVSFSFSRSSRRDIRAANTFCVIDTATTEIYTLSLHDALPI